MRMHTYPNKQQFDRRVKEIQGDRKVHHWDYMADIYGETSVVGVWNSKNELVELFRWVDLT